MKKTIFLLLTLCSSLFVNAQTFIRELPREFRSNYGSGFYLKYISKYLVNAGVPYIYSSEDNGANASILIDVYNEKFEDIRSFSINYCIEKDNCIIGAPTTLDIENYDSGKYIEYSFISQNFFNNDDHFEYVCPLYDKTNSSIVEYDRNGDGIIDSKWVSGKKIGFIVFSDDGSE